MPLCSLHLVQLKHASAKNAAAAVADEPFAARRRFLRRLVSSSDLDANLLLACVVRRPVIVATRVDHVTLNKTAWDLVLVFVNKQQSSSSSSPSSSSSTTVRLATHPTTKADVSKEYILNVGVPSRLTSAYNGRTSTLIEASQHANVVSMDDVQSSPARSVSNYAPKTSQMLELSPDLVDLVDDLHALAALDGLVDARGPVQQLNLLAFNTSAEDKERYHTYGRSFAEVAKPFGGEAKVVGTIVSTNEAEARKTWDEVALVHYHSIDHFAAMAASEAYQSINRAYRLPSLDDTTIVCTQEVDLSALRARVILPQQQAQL